MQEIIIKNDNSLKGNVSTLITRGYNLVSILDELNLSGEEMLEKMKKLPELENVVMSRFPSALDVLTQKEDTPAQKTPETQNSNSSAGADTKAFTREEIAQLRETAKTMGIRNYHNKGVAKLVEEIEKLSADFGNSEIEGEAPAQATPETPMEEENGEQPESDTNEQAKQE